MLDYILRGGVTQHADFFTPEKFESVKQDLKTIIKQKLEKCLLTSQNI